MGRYNRLIAVVGLFLGCSLSVCFAQDFIWENISKEMTGINAVWVSSDDSRIIYVGAERGIFKSQDSGAHWKRILRGKNTRKAYYQSLVLLSNGTLYLGTKEGLLVSKDNGKTWCKLGGELGHILIQALACDKSDKIYVLSEGKVFKVNPDVETYEKVLWKEYSQENDSEQNDDSKEEAYESTSISKLRYIAVDYNTPAHIYLAMSSKILESEDEGKSWRHMSISGLSGNDIKFITVSVTSRIYAVSDSGVFTYNKERWEELPLGFSADDIHALTVDAQGNIYVATEKGLFKESIGEYRYGAEEYKGGNSVNESTIQQVQQAAIKYAEVEPEKIARWRKQAAKRAWLPKITVDMDRDMDRTVSNSIWGIYSSYGNGGTITAPGRYFVGPDDETRYNNKNWGVSLTWELGDLIWSDDQTSIDVRSRLMVELRNDILDEVTKIYFERKRVEAELDNLPINDKKGLEKEIRLQELTALLDGFTGGYFSRHQ